VPKFECHAAVAAVVSAVAVATGGAVLGWDKTAASLAFLAGLSGGMVPDLDADESKPLRLAGALVGVGAAAAVVGFVTSPGKLLNRPWPASSALWAAVGAYFLFNAVFVDVIRRRTVHRGLFHSLAAPFMYGGIWAAICTSAGAKTVMAVWSLAVIGVLTHLILDAGKSMSFNPLKVATKDLGASTRLWILTALINLLAFTRLSLP
jgi:membrane-bound metal-dependent hydrolase YbcI (DUF457 family)